MFICYSTKHTLHTWLEHPTEMKAQEVLIDLRAHSTALNVPPMFLLRQSYCTNDFDRKFTNSEYLLAEMADKFSFEF
jgi:hypothetical protein